MKNILAFLFCLLLLTGCDVEPTKIEPTNNSQIKLSLLFEHDGYKMYRFEDGGRAVYWSTAPGRISYETSHKGGSTKTETIIEGSIR